MDRKLETLKIAASLPKRYWKARSLLKKDDHNKSWQYLKKIAQDIIKTAKIKIEVINLNNHNDFSSSFILANHQSNYDIVSLLVVFDSPIKFVAKKELFKLPLFRTFIKLSQAYPLNRNDARQGVKVFKDTVIDVNNNSSNVVIFPEGTRATSLLMAEFNSGLFNIIKRVNKCLIPIYIEYNQNKEIKIIIGQEIKKSDFNDLTGLQLRDLIYDKICELKKEYGSKKTKYNVLGLGDSLTFGENQFKAYGESFFHKTINKLAKESLLHYEINLAIPGATINDLERLIISDNYQEQLTQAVTNEKLVNNLITRKEKSVVKLLKESDYLIMSIGANDLLKIIKKGKINNQYLYKEVKVIYQKTDQLLNLIKKINPQLKIFLVGLYFPYPHSPVLQKLNKITILDSYYRKLEHKHDNLKCLIISKVIEEHKHSFIPHKRNIHLSDKGYEYIANEIIKNFKDVESERLLFKRIG